MQLHTANRGRTAVTLRDRNNNCQEGVSPAIKHTSADNRPPHAKRMMIVMRGGGGGEGEKEEEEERSKRDKKCCSFSQLACLVRISLH